MRNILVVATFFCLWLSTQFSDMVQDYMAYTLILTFGILHGANDIFIVSQLNTEKQRFIKILLPYLLVIALVSLLFLVSQTMALILFVLISAYHFGEQHFKSGIVKPNKLVKVLYVSFGLLILFMIFYFQFEQVSLIIEEISGYYFNIKFYRQGLIFTAISFLIVFITMLRYGFLKVNVFKEILMFLVFLLVFSVASLSWAFAIYFILWHSIPSLNDQMIFLYGDSSKTNFLKYLKTSWLYWMISIFGLALFYVLFRNQIEYFITVLLYVLAVITFPHVIVMSRVEASKN